MSKILAEITSSSNPGKKYQIIEPDNGGDAYCTCWAWKKNRTCKHLLEFFHPTAVKARQNPLEKAIDDAVLKLKIR